MQLGFARGDKVTNQAGVPAWILAQREYRRSCLRGLMDTDGSVYAYEHTVYGRRYRHMALCFTNRSHPLLRFVEETLRLDGYRPTAAPFRIYLHRKVEVAKYFSEVSSHNSKHLQRYQAFSNNGTVSRRGTQVVDGAALEKR